MEVNLQITTYARNLIEHIMAFKKLNSIFCTFLLTISLMGSLAAQSDEDAYRIDVFSTSETPLVDIRTSGGSIEVNGHSGNQVEVKMFVKQGRQYLTPDDTDLSDFEITIEQEGDRVVAEARKDDEGWTSFFRSGRNISISFHVMLPENSVVDGRTSGGSVSAKNIHNQLSLRTSGGSITAEQISGEADLRTSGGSISLEDIYGEMNARTSGGSISAANIRGESDLRTSGGSIRLENIAAKLSARTSGGSIRAHLSEFNDDLSLRTSGGSIRINMPYTEHFNIDLRGGRVNTELRNFTGESGRNRISGKVGEGGPALTARTSGSTVSLEYH